MTGFKFLPGSLPGWRMQVFISRTDLACGVDGVDYLYRSLIAFYDSEELAKGLLAPSSQPSPRRGEAASPCYDTLRRERGLLLIVFLVGEVLLPLLPSRGEGRDEG